MVTRRPPSGSSSVGFYDALGHIIKVARTDLGIERRTLAERAGISYSYLAAIENGQKQPSSRVLLALAEALGLRTHELLESAEGRRDRTMSLSEEPPEWLTGPAEPRFPWRLRSDYQQQPAGSAAATPLSVSAAGIADDDAHAEFLDRLDRLARRITDSDRQLLLEMATKLAVKRTE